MRDRHRTLSEQEGEQRRREGAGKDIRLRSHQAEKKGGEGDTGGFSKAQVKTKIKSLEKWKRKNGKLSELDQNLLLELKSLDKKQRIEEKSKKDLEQSEHQRKMFEEAVKNVGADVSTLELPKVIQLEDEAEDEKNVEIQPKANKKKNTSKTKTAPGLNENQSSRMELVFPAGEGTEEGAFSKPSVQESLNKIKLRNEMKKKMSLDSLKSKKTKPTKESQKATTKVEKTKGKGVQAKESDSKEFKTKVAKEALPDTAITSLFVLPKKKGKVKLRGKKKKASQEEDCDESTKSSVDNFDYNQVMPLEVEAGTLNYFAPLQCNALLPKLENKTSTDAASGKPITKCVSQSKEAVKTDKRGKRKKEEYLERNSHRFIKGDFQLMAFAQDFLHIKECEEAESNFRRLNP